MRGLDFSCWRVRLSNLLLAPNYQWSCSHGPDQSWQFVSWLPRAACLYVGNAELETNDRTQRAANFGFSVC